MYYNTSCSAINRGKYGRGQYTYSFRKGAAIRFLQPLPGIFKSVEGVDEARGISGVIEVGFMKKIGEVIPELSNGLDRVGYVITQGNTREEAVRLCGQAVKKIKFEMV